MTTETYLASLVLAFTLGLWTHWRIRHGKAIASAQDLCNHVFGEPYSLYDEGRFWQKKCAACGFWTHCEADGSPLRRDDE